jgi:hypothetical protein
VTVQRSLAPRSTEFSIPGYVCFKDGGGGGLRLSMDDAAVTLCPRPETPKPWLPTYVNGLEDIKKLGVWIFLKIRVIRVGLGLAAYKARLGFVFMCTRIKLY